MAIYSGFLDGVTNALSGSALRQALAIDLFSTFPCKTTAGVRYTTGSDLQVAFSSGLAFSIQPGSCVTGSSTALNAGYPVISDTAINVSTTAANATNPRIDLLYAYVLDDGSGTVGFEFLQGTPAPSPVAPTILRANFCLLAQVTVPAGIGSNLATATVSDQRVWLRQAVNPNGFRALGAGATADLNLTTTFNDVAGCSLTFTTRRANVTALVTANFEMGIGSPGTPSGDTLGACVVDGSLQLQQPRILSPAILTTSSRMTITGTWTVNLASAGSHTIKLQGRKTVADGIAHTLNGTNTTLNILILE